MGDQKIQWDDISQSVHKLADTIKEGRDKDEVKTFIQENIKNVQGFIKWVEGLEEDDGLHISTPDMEELVMEAIAKTGVLTKHTKEALLKKIKMPGVLKWFKALSE